jgi:flagellar assembly protein FliH
MIRAQKFSFDEEFGGERRSGSSRRSADLHKLEEAEHQGFARGVLEGRREAEEEAAMRAAHAMEQLAIQAGRILAHLDDERLRFEREAATLALAFARKLAGDLVDRQPIGPLQEAAEECFRHLVGTPHIVVTLPQEHVDRAKATLDRMAAQRGYDGRLIVLGDPDMDAGDFRLEWADGGVSRDARSLSALIATSIARHVGAGTGPDLD